MWSLGNPLYRYEYDDHGGINYFMGDTPITNEQYAKATGENTNTLEAQASERFNYFGSAGVAGPLPPVQGPANPRVRNYGSIPQYTAGTGSTATEAAPLPGQDGYQAQIVRIGDKAYDVNDPGQRQAFLAAKTALVDQTYNRSLSDLDYYLQNATKDAETSYGTNLATIRRNREDLARERSRYETDYTKSVNDFGEGWRGGNAGRVNYFASLSPAAYQSGMGSSAKYAEDKYIAGLSDMAGQKADAMNEYDTTAFDLNTDESNLEQGYNRFITDTQRYGDSARTSLAETRTNDMNSLADTLSSYDVSQKINPFRYDLKAYQAPNKSQADLSAYTPYTNFNSLATSPTATNYFKPKLTNATVAEGDLSAYLGKNTLTKEQEDQLRKSLTKGY